MGDQVVGWTVDIISYGHVESRNLFFCHRLGERNHLFKNGGKPSSDQGVPDVARDVIKGGLVATVVFPAERVIGCKIILKLPQGLRFKRPVNDNVPEGFGMPKASSENCDFLPQRRVEESR